MFLARYARLRVWTPRQKEKERVYLLLSESFVQFKAARYLSLLVHYLRLGGYQVVLVASGIQGAKLVLHRFGKPLVTSGALAGIRASLPASAGAKALVVTDSSTPVPPGYPTVQLRYGYE